MQLYLAAAWSRKDEVRGIAEELNKIPGVKVVARWLFEPKPNYGGEDIMSFRQARAIADVEDVAAANVLVRFSDDLSHATVPASLATGARMFEMGFAFAHGKKIIVIGGFQPIFDYLPGIIHLRTVDELKAYLAPVQEAVHVG